MVFHLIHSLLLESSKPQLAICILVYPKAHWKKLKQERGKNVYWVCVDSPSLLMYGVEADGQIVCLSWFQGLWRSPEVALPKS